MSWMHREREKRGVEDDIISWPGQLEEWSCQFTEMRNNECGRRAGAQVEAH